MLSSIRSFMRAAAAPSHRGCSIRLGCGTPDPVEAPVPRPEPGLMPLEPNGESCRQLKRADDQFKVALIQLSIAKKLLIEVQDKRLINEQIDLKEEVQANLMKSFCSLLVEKEDKRVRSLEKILYHGILTREEMLQRRKLRSKLIEHPLESEEVGFVPTAEIALAQRMAYDEPDENYIELYRAHYEAFKIASIVKETMGKIQRDLAEQQIQGKMCEIPGGVPVPFAPFSLDKVEELTKVIVDLSQLEQLDCSARCSLCAQKIDIEFANRLLNKARVLERQRERFSGRQYDIQAWNAVLDRLIKNNKWKERGREIQRLKKDVESIKPKVYAVAAKILEEIKTVYRNGNRMLESCVPDLSYQILSHAYIDENDQSLSVDEEKI